MSIALNIKLDARNVTKFTKGLSKRLTTSMRAALLAGGRDIVGKAKELSPRDTGRLANSTDSALLPSPELAVVIFSRVKYSLFVHGGAKFRRKQPPAEALLAWARRHLARAIIRKQVSSNRWRFKKTAVNFKPKVKRDDALSLAYAVAVAIKRRGYIKARPYMKNAIEKRMKNVTKLINAAAAKVLAAP